MRNKQLTLDIAVGGALAFLLLSIFVIDRLVTPASADGDGQAQAGGGGTLLGDPRIVGQIKALGDVERLEKLKVVRLTAKARFAGAANVNDITLMWCWEPNMIIRFQEDNPEQVRKLGPLLDLRGEAVGERLLGELKTGLEFGSDADLERRFDGEFRTLLARKEYAALFSSVLLLEGRQAFLIFNERLALPMKPARTTNMRNLCFALSISNLIPVRRHKFEIDTGAPETVRGKKCKQFIVKDHDGLRLEFYFDEGTNLLAKISHMGHDPGANTDDGRQVLWEHYFSDYREADGIKQWRRLEAHTGGRPFATLDVTGVEFFDEMRPELRRPRH
jgi:hypothetical protein